MQAKEKLESRLKELPTEQLVQLLMIATKGNPRLRKELLVLTAETKELVSSVKRTITSLHKLDGSMKRLSSGTISAKVRDAISAIARIADSSADDAFELLCSLITTEGHIHEQVDDSSGFITGAFRGALTKRAQSIVLRCKNEKVLLASLLVACKHDEFGSVLDFIDAVAPSLPEGVVRKVIDDIVTREPQVQSQDRFAYDSNVGMHKRFLVALGEVDEYVSLSKRTTGLHVSDHLTIAQMYCDQDATSLLESEFLNIVMSAPVPDIQSIALLVKYGFISEMSNVLASMSRPNSLDYYALSMVAVELMYRGSWLGATSAFRLLVEDILHHSRTGAYPLGASYLGQLRSLSGMVEAWGSMLPHEVYMLKLRERHILKTSFWKYVVKK